MLISAVSLMGWDKNKERIREQEKLVIGVWLRPG